MHIHIYLKDNAGETRQYCYFNTYVGGIKIKVEESNEEILSWSDTRC